MSNSNPYRAPPEIVDPNDQPSSSVLLGETLGIEFETDWSQQGLKERRHSDWHRMGDIGLVLVVTLTVGSLMLGPAILGLFCLLMPVSVIYGVLWLSGRRVRSGASFARKFPALAGPVSGKILGNLLYVRGPGMEVVTRVAEAMYPMMSARGGLVRMPGVDEAVPVMELDVVHTWPISKEPADRVNKRLIDYLSSESQPHLVVSGEVTGRDFRGLSCRRQWLSVAALALCLGAVGFAWAAIKFSRLPSWVANPPGHYRLNSSEEFSLIQLWVLGAGAALLVSVGTWFLYKAFRVFGEFTAVISPRMIAIATPRAVYGYQEKSLSHFQWTEQGIVVRDLRNQAIFILPSRWFDEHETKQAATWFQRIPTPNKSMYYLTPKV
ncbi:MAG: hypothetical protein ACR2NZ_22990 [Rubripirellula sp.]